MKKILGAVLIVFGVIGIAYGGLTYTTKETVLDMGPIQATRDKSHSVPLPPVAGAVALAGGIFLVVSGSKS